MKNRKRHGKFGETGLNNWSICKYKQGTEPSLRKGKLSLLASYIDCKCSMETTRYSENVNLGLNVMKLVKKSDWYGSSRCNWSRVGIS